MKLNAYTIFDRKSLAYNTPFFQGQDGAALRMFSDLANDGQSTIARHPEDFVLFRIGTYDDEKGELLPIMPLVHVGDALALVAKSPVEQFNAGETIKPLNRRA